MQVLEQYIIASKLICRPQGASVQELAEALQISERAVFNLKNQLGDILALKPISDPDNRRFVRYVAESSNVNLHLPEMEMSETDKAYMRYLKDASDIEVLEKTNARFFNKVGIMFAQRGTYPEIKTVPLAFHRSARLKANKRHSDDNIEKLIGCIDKKQWVKLIEEKDGKEEVVKLFPLVVLISDDGSFLYAISMEETLLCLNLNSVKDVGRGMRGQEPNLRPDIKAIVSDPFGADWDTEPMSVELVLFGKAAETEPSKIWPDSVSFEEKDNGTVHMTAKTHSRRGCIRWILGRTPDVKVISPQGLKDEISTIYKKALS